MMVGSSSEYTITKPGMERRRQKPLKTYGRRVVPTEARSEPVVKRRKLEVDESRGNAVVRLAEEVEPTAEAPQTEAGREEGDDAEAGAEATENNAAPSSILRYFKPKPSQPAPIAIPPSPATAPSSPPRRRNRLLRVRSNPADEASPRPALHDTAANRKRRRSVQTTLNISAQPAFSECKVCDTVFNPLWPEDVSFHEKRHRGVVRKSRVPGS